MSTIIYADGACRGNQNKENIGAWGAYIVYEQGMTNEFTVKLSDVEYNTTNNRMELTSAIEGIRDVVNSDFPCKFPIIIYMDSQYVVQGATSWIHNWLKTGWRTASNKPVENQDLWIELYKLTQKYHIMFTKVKGHSGHHGNEKADELCNIAMDNALARQQELKHYKNEIDEISNGLKQTVLISSASPKKSDIDYEKFYNDTMISNEARDIWHEIDEYEKELIKSIPTYLRSLKAIVQNPDFVTPEIVDKMIKDAHEAKNNFIKLLDIEYVVSVEDEIRQWLNKIKENKQ